MQARVPTAIVFGSVQGSAVIPARSISRVTTPRSPDFSAFDDEPKRGCQERLSPTLAPETSRLQQLINWRLGAAGDDQPRGHEVPRKDAGTKRSCMR